MFFCTIPCNENRSIHFIDHKIDIVKFNLCWLRSYLNNAGFNPIGGIIAKQSYSIHIGSTNFSRLVNVSHSKSICSITISFCYDHSKIKCHFKTISRLSQSIELSRIIFRIIGRIICFFCKCGCNSHRTGHFLVFTTMFIRILFPLRCCPWLYRGIS